MTSIESKYLAKFKNVEGKFHLNGARILVEVLPKKELKTASGLILNSPDSARATAESYRAVLGVVILTGEGYVDEDGNDIPMETKVGDVVLLNEFGMKYYSEFPGLLEYSRNTIAMSSEGEIQMRFSGVEELEQFEALLNQK